VTLYFLVVYNISGLRANDHEKITMPLKGVLKDNVSNLRILVHIPPPSNRNGAVNPQVEAGGLSEIVGWGTYYPLPDIVRNSGTGHDSATGYSNYDSTITTSKAGSFYHDAIRITDFKSRSWCIMEINSTNDKLFKYATFPGYKDYLKLDDGQLVTHGKYDPAKHELILVRPKMMAMMSSAILCTKPGKQTGELLMAYPVS